MNNGLARSTGMALLAVCVGVTASQSLAKCPRSCTAEFRNAFKACKVSCHRGPWPVQDGLWSGPRRGQAEVQKGRESDAAQLRLAQRAHLFSEEVL